MNEKLIVFRRYGNEVADEGFVEKGEDVEAGTRADGVDPETSGRIEVGDAKTEPASAGVVEADLEKEKSVAQEAKATPEVEAEAGKATKDEL